MSFVKLESDLLARPDLTSTAKLVYAAIVDAMRRKDRAWPSVRYLARVLGLTHKPIIRGIRELEDATLIVVERRERGQSTVYRLPEGVGQIPTLPNHESVGQTPQAVGQTPTEAREKLPHKQNRVKKQSGRASRLRSSPVRSERTKKRTPDPRVTAFIAHWRLTFEKHHGKPWVDASPAKDRKLIRGLLHRLDDDRPGENAFLLLSAAADRLCRDGLRWAAGTPSIGLLAKGINELLPKPSSLLASDSASHHPVAKLAADRFADDVAAHDDEYRELGRRIDAGELPMRQFKTALSEALDGPALRATLDSITEPKKAEVAYA